MSRLLVAVWLISSTLPASAHPGHGDGGSGPEHYLTEPIHAIGLWGSVAVAVGVLVAWAALSRRPTDRHRPLD